MKKLILVLLSILIAFSGFRVISILLNYKTSDDEYNSLKTKYTVQNEKYEPGTDAEPAGNDTEDVEAEVVPPISVDWDGLKAANDEVVGWLYIEAIPNISYPVCHTENDTFYLHHTYEKKDLFAGALFSDCDNKADFSDPNTIVYGHNMRSGSMFGTLKEMRQQEIYDKSHYFWILTPSRNYRYVIYSVYGASVGSEPYTMFQKNGTEVMEWEKKLQGLSEIQNNIEFTENDKTVTLSTCTSDSSVRCVVIGKMDIDEPVGNS